MISMFFVNPQFHMGEFAEQIRVRTGLPCKAENSEEVVIYTPYPVTTLKEEQDTFKKYIDKILDYCSFGDGLDRRTARIPVEVVNTKSAEPYYVCACIGAVLVDSRKRLKDYTDLGYPFIRLMLIPPKGF